MGNSVCFEAFKAQVPVEFGDGEMLGTSAFYHVGKGVELGTAEALPLINNSREMPLRDELENLLNAIAHSSSRILGSLTVPIIPQSVVCGEAVVYILMKAPTRRRVGSPEV